jgi:hypothetical protein
VGIEVTNSAVTLAASRGVKLVGKTLSVALPPGKAAVRDLAIMLEIDFGASVLNWSFADRETRKTQGPFTTPYTGKLVDVNAVDVVVRGPQGAIDELVIEAH